MYDAVVIFGRGSIDGRKIREGETRRERMSSGTRRIALVASSMTQHAASKIE